MDLSPRTLDLLDDSVYYVGTANLATEVVLNILSYYDGTRNIALTVRPMLGSFQFLGGAALATVCIVGYASQRKVNPEIAVLCAKGARIGAIYLLQGSLNLIRSEVERFNDAPPALIPYDLMQIFRGPWVSYPTTIIG